MNILLPCVVASLLLLVIHWLPWAALLGRKLPKLIEMGLLMIGVMLPASVTIWWVKAGSVESLVIMWCTAVSGGLLITLAYLIDDWAEKGTRAVEAEAREKVKDETIDQFVERQR